MKNPCFIMTFTAFLKNFYQNIAAFFNLKNAFLKRGMLISLILISFSEIQARPFEMGTIKGSLTDERNVPVPYGSVVLKNTNDSSLYKVELSNDQGVFFFDLVKEGNYFMQIKEMGFEMFTKLNIEVNEKDHVINLGILKLVRSSNALKTISVVAEKPFIERLSDNTVVNIENSILNTGSTVLGVMEKLPGVLVSDQGTISLKGKPNVTVYIDGQSTMLSEENVAALLRGMPSSNIQKIEIITNPSAKYDAAGSAGIINIVTKKNGQAGLNGNINAGYGQGRYEKGNGALDLSRRDKKCNLFLSYSFSHRKEFNDFRLVRDFPITNDPNSVIESNSYTISPNNNHTPRLGADIYLSKGTKLSIIGSGIFYRTHAINNSNSNIVDANSKKINSFDLINDVKGAWNGYMGSTSIVHQLDTNRKEISFDLDYANYLNKVDQMNTIISKDANDQFVDKVLYIGNQNWKLDIYSAKVDYSQPLNKRFFVETGLKSSYVNSNSDNTFFNKILADLIYDSIRSNHFLYSENINSAYLTIRSEFKKITLQPGIRLEQTVVDGEQLLTKQKIKRNYINLFPSVSVSYKADDKNEWNINLTRRINRPPYQLLDPFRLLTDVGTYTQGNPNLKPETTYSNELSYFCQKTFFATFGYSLTLDRISPALIHDVSKEITLRTFVNLDYLHFYNLDLTYSKKITSWWSTNTTLTPFYQRYSGSNNGYTIYKQKTFSFWFNTNNNFYLANGISMECSFFYQHTNSVGLSIIKPMYNLSAGIKKMLFNERGSLTINLSDLVLTNYRRGTARFGTADAILISNFQGHWDSRILNVTFSYRFGNGKAGKMRRASGADDEKSRINVN